jgi:hypothetical protein
MKTFNVISRSLAIVALSFTALAVSAKSVRTETVVYQGKAIPSVSLKEVVVSAPAYKSHSVLCAMQLHKGKYIPSVNLDEISVSASGAVSHHATVNQSSKAVLIPAVLVDGEYIADVDLNEVQVVAPMSVSENTAVNEPVSSETNNQIFKVSMRQGFNRLLNYLMEKGKDVVASAFPAMFSK